MNLFADSEGLDQTARMRRLIEDFTDRICPKTRFRMVWPIFSDFIFIKERNTSKKKVAQIYERFEMQESQRSVWKTLK